MRLISGLLIIALTAVLNVSAFSGSGEGKDDGLKWYTDLSEAHELSQKTGLPIFGFFTGSDWCGWCMRLQREVFAKQAFIDWAKDNVVLLELDFPRRKEQPAELKKQNQDLQRAFQVSGYPTVWLFYSTKDPETSSFKLSALGKLGYPSGAVKGKEEEKFLENANKILAENKTN